MIHPFICLFYKENELEDNREHCFVIEAGPGSVYYLNVETKTDLYKISRAWHSCNYYAIKQMQVSWG